MKFLLLALVLMSAVACNGGGGSSSSTGGAGGSTGGSGSGGSTSGGDGNASYYGFNVTSNTPIEDAVAPSSASNVVLANEFYVKIDNASARLIDIAIFQPTCLLGADYAYYSALNMNGDLNEANAVSALVSSSSITFYRHKFNIAGRTRFDEGTAETISGTCTDGEFVLSGGKGSVYSNGKMLVAKLNTTLLVGVKSNLQETSTSIAFDFTAYSQTDDHTCNLSGCVGGGNTQGTLSSVDAYSFTNGSVNTYLGNGTVRLYSVGGGLADTSHMMLEGTGGYAPTLIFTLNSKKVFFSALPDVNQCTVANPAYCIGSVGVIFGLQ
jgi:hypothetical protein